jgi:hypothetical protein
MRGLRVLAYTAPLGQTTSFSFFDYTGTGAVPARAAKFVIALLTLLWVTPCWSSEFDQPARALTQKIIAIADYITQHGKNLKILKDESVCRNVEERRTTCYIWFESNDFIVIYEVDGKVVEINVTQTLTSNVIGWVVLATVTACVPNNASQLSEELFANYLSENYKFRRTEAGLLFRVRSRYMEKYKQSYTIVSIERLH